MRKLIVYHTSNHLFFDFDLSKTEGGDLNTDYETGKVKQGVFFSENPIPYYSNRFTYKCEVSVDNENDILLTWDKFDNSINLVGELFVTAKDRIKILEIAEISPEEQQAYYKTWDKERQKKISGKKHNPKIWVDSFSKVFKKNKIIINN